MADIFDNTILCKNCDKKMERVKVVKNGFLFRAVNCGKCNSKIIHPSDEENYNKFMNLKNKKFSVKMRLVGNSYAVSIPKEIVSFMNEQEKKFKDLDNMVKLCFEEMGKVSLDFGTDNEKSRSIKTREVRVIKNNKPVFHSKQFYDSAHPERNVSKIYKEKNHN